MSDSLLLVGNILGDLTSLDQLHPFLLVEVVSQGIGFVLEESWQVFVHHRPNLDKIGWDINLGVGIEDLFQVPDLEGSSDKLLSLESKKILAKFSLVDDALDDKLSVSGSASNVAGGRAAAPHVTVVSVELVPVLAGHEVVEGGPLFTLGDITSLGEAEVFLFGAGFWVWHEVGVLDDHVLGEFTNLEQNNQTLNTTTRGSFQKTLTPFLGILNAIFGILNAIFGILNAIFWLQIFGIENTNFAFTTNFGNINATLRQFKCQFHGFTSKVID